MGMSLDRAIKVQSDMVNRVRDLHSTARHFHLTSAEINARYSKLWDATPKATPNHVREYVRGYHAALTDSLYRGALVYGGYIGDSFYSTHRDRADYYEKHGIEPREYADAGRVQRCGHYWADNPAKPFFV